MAKPRVFLSSTYYDLKHIRSSIENFIESLGFESVLSEKGNIAYNPDLPLDDSCYHEVRNCDIFVLIIGGRYGSPASIEEKNIVSHFYTRYESITKNEYINAVRKDIPVYILIERQVYAEYETFKKNRTNENIVYAHVDSVNIFHLIDEILSQPRNNPIHQFEKHRDIEYWLREQWSGLFRDLLYRKSEQKQLISLTEQVEELSIINQTLKNYLEEIIGQITKGEAKKIIQKESTRLNKSKQLQELKKQGLFRDLINHYEVTSDEAIEVFSESISLEDLLKRLEIMTNGRIKANIIDTWESEKDEKVKSVAEIRKLLNLKEIPFRDE